MKFLTQLLRRDSSEDESPAEMNSTIVTLLSVLLVLFALTLLLVGTLLVFRHKKRRARQQQSSDLPLYNSEKSSSRPTSSSSTASHHRRVMVRPSESIHIYHEKQQLMNAAGSDMSDSSSPSSPIPEIRITFPEEVDETTGKRVSGRMVMVHVGDSGEGLEPYVSEDSLPRYGEKDHGSVGGGRFDSVDLDRVGGLVEKGDKRDWN